MPPDAANKTLEIWFQDEARVGQQGTLSYMGAPRGSRPAGVRDNRRLSTYVFGAICPERGVGAAMIMPYANSKAMNIHLDEISRDVSPGAHAVLVCDGAGWHQDGKTLTVPGNISLLRLPPYSAELNPMENVWEYIRANKLSMTVWQSYTEIVNACCAAWNDFIADTTRVASVTTRSWASVKT